MTRRMFVALLCGVLAPAPVLASGGSAPATSGVHGVVTVEGQGLLLPKVSVTLRSETNRGFVRVRATDRKGAFTFDELPAGLYSLEARRAGFEDVKVSPILLLEGSVRKEHIALPVDTEPPSQRS